MRLATLIVNPVAAKAHLLQAQMPAIQRVFENHGYSVSVSNTTAAEGSTRLLASTAAGPSALVLACGGDGTVHGVVQGLAGTAATLGIVPLGTANALARNLGVPLDPLAAVERLMTYTARRIPLGEITASGQKRMFAVMAGCGPDGLLVDELSREGGGRLKAKFGRLAYYGHAARLFATRRWPDFQVRCREPGSTASSSAKAVALMVSRIPDLGGVFSGTTPRASLTDNRLHVQILGGPAWLSMPAWMFCGRLGLPNPWLRTVDASEVECDGDSVFAQADGEPLGHLPISLRIVEDALNLLMP
jgi:YegS/Rv2252/BmrU family lipid kinase